MSLQSGRIHFLCPFKYRSFYMQLLDLHYERFHFSPSERLNVGFEHLIVPKEKFTLLTPWDAIRTYTFATGTARHYFCGTCGISSFYLPRSNPNGYSVNSACVCPTNDRSTFGASIGMDLRTLNGIRLMDKIGNQHFVKVTSESVLNPKYNIHRHLRSRFSEANTQ
jgi:hypothetical protein